MFRDQNVLVRGYGMMDSRYGITSYVQNSLFDSVTKFVQTRYGEEIYISNNIMDANNWIKKYDSKYNQRAKNDNGLLINNKFLISLPDKNTFAFVQIGGRNNGSIVIYNDRDNRADKDTTMTIYIFGKQYKKYMQELSDCIQRKNDTELYIYNIKGYSSDSKEDGIDSVGHIMHKRDIDSLYFNPGIKEEIFAHIDSFNENKGLYESRDLTYKTGILLHGEPGTGKTSLATALATKYGRNLIVLDLATFANLDIATLTSCINADSDKFIVLLEDIDAIFPSLNRAEDDLNEKERIVVNKMLQFLDSSSSPNDVIFLATTNHYEKLDKAILRDGRFDLKVEISLINQIEATEMIKSFDIEGDGVKEILAQIKESPNTQMKDGVMYVNPSELQNKILSYFKNKAKMEVNE